MPNELVFNGPVVFSFPGISVISSSMNLIIAGVILVLRGLELRIDDAVRLSEL